MLQLPGSGARLLGHIRFLWPQLLHLQGPVGLSLQSSECRVWPEQVTI